MMRRVWPYSLPSHFLHTSHILLTLVERNVPGPAEQLLPVPHSPCTAFPSHTPTHFPHISHTCLVRTMRLALALMRGLLASELPATTPSAPVPSMSSSSSSSTDRFRSCRSGRGVSEVWAGCDLMSVRGWIVGGVSSSTDRFRSWGAGRKRSVERTVR